MQFIDLMAQQRQRLKDGRTIREAVDCRITEVLNHGRYILGPEVEELEATLSAYVGVGHCIAVASGTDALLIALMALGVQAGDEVITTPFSFISTSETIALLGAVPVYVDIDPLTSNLSISKLEEKLEHAKKIGKLPKVLIPVHLQGQSCEMDKIKKLSNKYKFKILEDASHALGGSYKDNKVGSCSFSDACVFSFHPVKNITSGEGGALLTNNRIIDKKIKLPRSHGITEM